jgi:chromate transporter
VRSIALTLLAVFVPLSLVSVGGGQTVVADIHRQVVANHQWLTESQFVDAFAISRMAPGPGTLLVTLIGWDVAGLWGALVASIAIFVPSALLVYGIARLWARYRGARWQLALEAGLRPVAAGMILASVLVLIEALEGGWVARGIALASTGLLMLTKVNPIVLMAAGAVVFIALHSVMPA